MSLYQRMSSPGFQSNVRNIGSPLMQQRQAGVQSGQAGGQFGSYMQQLQKQIGGLQNQIQAMSQKQQVNTPSAAGNKFLNKIGYNKNNQSLNPLAQINKRLEDARNATYEDTVHRFNNKSYTVSADQMKQYRTNRVEGDLAAYQKRQELSEKHGSMNAAANQEYDSWYKQHFSRNKMNEEFNSPTEFFTPTYSATPL